MKRKQLILLHVLFLISFLLIFVFGPFYTNYLRENLEDWEDPDTQSYPNLNFTSTQGYILLQPTPLDQYSYITVNFTSTQPIYVVITQSYSLYMSTSMPFYEKSIFDTSGTLAYETLEPGNYTVVAEGFGGEADFTVTYSRSIVSRSTPYALWGQIMNYGGIVLLVSTATFFIIAWLRKRKPLPKQLSKAISATKKPEKER